MALVILIGLALQTLTNVAATGVVLGSSAEATFIAQDCGSVALEAWSSAGLADERLMGDEATGGYEATGGCTPYATGLEVFVQGDLPE